MSVFVAVALKRQLPSIELYNMDHARFEKLIHDLLLDRLNKMIRTYNVKYVGKKLELIASYMLGGKSRQWFETAAIFKLPFKDFEDGRI
jgi:hypothetical protein